MADLDSRSKRASSVGLTLAWLLAPVFPDATLDQGDRQHIAWSYSGILASGGAGAGAYTQVHHHHHANG
jgi:hypothetical protein